MEILNDHQLAKIKGRILFHYCIDDESFMNQKENPATIDHYSITGNDLILTHENYHDDKYVATDTLRDWRLINVDMSDCDQRKLSKLTNDQGIKEIKIIEIRKGKKLIFNSYMGGVYTFKCEEIEEEVRGQSRKEIVDMLLEKEEHVEEIAIQNKKLCEFVTRLGRFINGESKDHQNLLALQEDKNNLQATRSKYCLEILRRIKDKLDDLENDLLKDAYKCRGKLV